MKAARTFLLLSGLLVGACGGTSEPRPNVLLVTIDTLRADHLSAYGYERETSPFLDELARESTLFGDALSQCGTTPQSLSSLMTGMFPYTDEVLTNAGPFYYLREECRPLAELLGEAGYRTHAITSSVQSSRLTGLDAGFDTFDGIEVDGQMGKRRRADEITRLAGEWIAAGRDDEPFFLWLHYLDPHYPYAAGKEYREAFGVDEFEPGGTRAYVFDEKQSDAFELSDGEILELVRDYDREILATDDALRELVTSLPEGLLDRTLFVFTADHGEALGEHGIISHNELYQSIVRVPLIVRPPGGGEGSRVDAPVMLVDLVPTILDYAGLPSDPRLRGQSLRRADGLDERLRVAEYVDDKAFLRGGLKWIRRWNVDELYALESDPAELRRLNTGEADAFAALQAAVRGPEPRPPSGEVAAPRVEPSADAIQELHDLGYAGD